MGVVGEIDRLAISAWAPAGLGGGYVACGTYAGAIDPSFASSASLELLSVDIQNSRLSVATECKTSEKFSSLAWGYPLRAHPAGLIAGGLNDGTVRIWDAATLLRSPKSGPDNEERAVVFGGSKFPKQHDKAVQGVCFNPRSPHMLASGGADAKILVWDLSNPSQGPSLRAPGAQQLPSGPSEEVSAIQWNLRVAHILGSGTASGVLRVWDLKQRRQVISIPSPNSRMRCSGIHWHPEIATQVLTTCDQDNGYGALLWDLRSPSQPIVNFSDFAPRGVSSASWCPQDSEMILFATRESRNIIVSSSTGKISCNLESSASPCFDLQWSPRIPGMYLTASIDGRLSVKSLLTAESARSVSVETANALAESFGEMATGFESGLAEQSPRIQTKQTKANNMVRPPKWLCRPASIAFASSGHYASFSKSSDRSVTIAPHRLSLTEFRESLSKLEDSLNRLSSDDLSPAENLCRELAKNAELKEDVMGFEVLRCLLRKNSRQELLGYLGYSASDQRETEPGKLSNACGLLQSDPIQFPVRTSSPTLSANGLATKEVRGDGIPVPAPSVSAISGPAPWDDVGNDHTENILDDDTGNLNTGNGDSSNDISASDADVGNSHLNFEGMSEASLSTLIRKSIVVGDLKKAVEGCLFVGRTSEALVLAQAGGPALWHQAQSHYLASLEAQDSRNVVAAVTGPVSKMLDFLTTVDGQSKDAWKEALAIVLTYVPGNELSEKCTALGQCLLLDGREGPALVCFLCAGNTEMAINVWKSDPPSTNNAVSASQVRIESLTSLAQKVRLVTVTSLVGLGESDISSIRALDKLSAAVLCEVGGLLALSGNLEAAIPYLTNLSPDSCGTYGSAGDILSMVSSSLSSSQFAGNTQFMPNNQDGIAFNENAGYSGYSEQYHNSPAPTSDWSQRSHGGVIPPPVPVPASPSVDPPTYSSQSQTTSRTTFDPYANAPSYGAAGYAPPPLPAAPAPTGGYAPPPSMPSVPASTTPSTFAPPALAAVPAPVAAPLNSSAPQVQPHASSTPTGPAPSYPSVSPMQPLQTLHQQQQPMQPMPPPPPPPTSDAPLPTSYHVKARPGDGKSLPPSAEVAVFEERRSKQAVVSGAPSGLPRRSHSSSSSLSSVGNEPSPHLDKTDPNSVPVDQQVIVKSLRGAYSYAVKRNNSMMYRKKMDDVNKKLGRLVLSLNKGTMEAEVIPHLIQVGQFIEKGKYDSASTVVGTLMSQHWDNNSQWIQALKRLIDCVLNGR